MPKQLRKAKSTPSAKDIPEGSYECERILDLKL